MNALNKEYPQRLDLLKDRVDSRVAIIPSWANISFTIDWPSGNGVTIRCSSILGKLGEMSQIFRVDPNGNQACPSR